MEWAVADRGGEEAGRLMRALALDYDSRALAIFEMDEPLIHVPDDVLFRVQECGVCGTDRELARFSFGMPPAGERKLVLGHEALGQVVEAGPSTGFRRGDWVVPMVRRACAPACACCARGRRDLCVSGGFRERGIYGAHGYFVEYAVDSAVDLLRVPDGLAEIAVLIEPMSVVEKALELGLAAHRNEPRTALVIGAGPVGLLAAMLFQLRGYDVTLFSLEEEDHPRARLVKDAGVGYCRSLGGMKFDVVVEACGSAQAAFQAIEVLGPCGAMVVLGAPDAYGEMPFLKMIIDNQTLLGSVNAAPEHFAAAIVDLQRLDRRILTRVLERRRFLDARETILSPAGDESKAVHVIAE